MNLFSFKCILLLLIFFNIILIIQSFTPTTNPSINPSGLTQRDELEASLLVVKEQSVDDLKTVREDILEEIDTNSDFVLTEYNSPVTGKKKYKYEKKV